MPANNRSKNLHDKLMGGPFTAIAGVHSRAMFGGYGLYRNGKIFAVIAEERLYFKVNDQNRPDYEHYGSKPFTYEHQNGRSMTMSYFELPELILNDSKKLLKWVEKSLACHQQPRAKKRQLQI